MVFAGLKQNNTQMVSTVPQSPAHTSTPNLATCQGEDNTRIQLRRVLTRLMFVAGLTLSVAMHAQAQPSEPTAPQPSPATAPSTTPVTTPASTPATTPASQSTDAAEQQAKTDASPSVTDYELTLSDGRTVRGKLIKRDQDEVVILLGDVATTFSTRAVASIREVAPLEARYRELKAAIETTDSPGLMRLADWLYRNERYDLAVIEIDNAIKADPGNYDARELRLIIVEQQKVAEASRLAREKREAQRKNAQTTEDQGNQDPDAVKQAETKASAVPLISEDDINIIRVYEVDLNNPPKLTIAPDVVEAFVNKFAGTRVEGSGTIPTSEQGRRIYARRKPVEILSDIFTLRAREFYPKVKVLENPRSMQLFRDNVNRGWLVNSCATTKCHGGEEAGRLRLYDKKQASDVAAYTNFIILERFRLPGPDGKRTVPLINYTEPANSPLLQMGLPRTDATITHPELGKVKMRPAFLSNKDERFQQTVEWIKAMYPKRPEYPISYVAPSGQSPHDQTPEPR